MVLISGILKGDHFTNVYNMRLFLITKILTIEEKRIIFKVEIDKIMSMPIINDKYKNNVNLYQYVSEHSSKNAYTAYDNNLTLLREVNAIKLYADDGVYSFISRNVYTNERDNYCKT
jgi:hypothetical protein